MSETSNQTVCVDEARTFFILPFVPTAGLARLADIRNRVASVTLGEFARAVNIRLGDSEQNSLQKIAHEPLWRTDEFPLASDYFHAFVQDIFGNRNPGNDSGPAPGGLSLPSLCLNEAGLNLLNGGLSNRADGLAMDLSSSATLRLEAAGVDVASHQIDDKTWLQFEISSARCVFFGTGVGILVLQVEHFKHRSNVESVDLILESNTRLARANFWKQRAPIAGIARYKDITKSASWKSESKKMPDWRARGLGQIAAILLTGQHSHERLKHSIQTVHWEKIPIMTGVRTSARLDPDSRLRVVTRLARKQTREYAPFGDEHADCVFRPFQPLTHAVSIEGGAVLVEAVDGVPEHIKNFIRNSMTAAYLPLMLWAMHEYLFLTELMRRTSREIDFARPCPGDLKRLREYRTRIYNYRLHFRYSHASAISMHNHMFNLWRATYDLATILDEMNQDVLEIDAYLESVHSEKQARKSVFWQRMTGMVVFFAGALIAVPDWIGKTVHDIAPSACAAIKIDACREFSLHYLLIGAAGLVLLAWPALRITGWLTRKAR